MINQTHPTAPPPELIEQWMQNHATKYDLARHAAQWGADQELEACCEWLKDASFYAPGELGKWLHEERRPKPPKFKGAGVGGPTR